MVGVSVNLKGARTKLSPASVARGRQALSNQALADMNPFVPMREGITRMTASVSVSGDGIIYNTPYAARLFYRQFQNYTTSGTGPRWDLKAEGLFLSSWIEATKRGAGW